MGGKKTAWCRFNVDKLPKLARLQAALSNTEDMIMFRPRKSINFDWTRLSFFFPFFTPLSCRLHHFHAVWKFMQSRKLSLRTICSFKKKKSAAITSPLQIRLHYGALCVWFLFLFFSKSFFAFSNASLKRPPSCFFLFVWRRSALNAKRGLLMVGDGGAERFPAHLREKEQSRTASSVSSPSVASFLSEVSRPSLRRNSDGGRKRNTQKTKQNTRRLENQPRRKTWLMQFTFQPLAFFFFFF